MNAPSESFPSFASGISPARAAPCPAGNNFRLLLETPRCLLPRRTQSLEGPRHVGLIMPSSIQDSLNDATLDVLETPLPPRLVRSSEFPSSGGGDNNLSVNIEQLLSSNNNSTNTNSILLLPSLDSPTPGAHGSGTRLTLKRRDARTSTTSSSSLLTATTTTTADGDEKEDDSGFDLEVAALSLPHRHSSNNNTLESLMLPPFSPPRATTTTNVAARGTPINSSTPESPAMVRFTAAAPPSSSVYSSTAILSTPNVNGFSLAPRSQLDRSGSDSCLHMTNHALAHPQARPRKVSWISLPVQRSARLPPGHFKENKKPRLTNTV